MSTALADIQKQLQQEMAGLQDTIAPSTSEIIKISNGRFVLPDGTTSGDPMTIVVLGWRWINRYYKNAFNPNNMESPACYAIHQIPKELEPSGGDDQQHTDCKGCPMNKFGTGRNGNGKACSNSVRVAVTSLDEKSDVLFLNVAATSLKSFNALLTSFENTEVHPLTAATVVTVATNVTYAKVGFEVGGLHKASLPVLMKKKEEANTILDAINFDYD